MKNRDYKLVKELGLVSFTDLQQSTEVYGVGWNGQFQKGIIKPSGLVYFEQEMGGVKSIENSRSCIEFEGKMVFPLRTVHSELYYKIK